MTFLIENIIFFIFIVPIGQNLSSTKLYRFYNDDDDTLTAC